MDILSAEDRTVSGVLLNQMLVILGLLVIGYVSCKSGVLNQEANDYFSAFLLKVSLPATILNSAFGEIGMSRGEVLYILGIAVAVYIIIPLLSHLLAGLLGLDATGEVMMNYSNIGFMGFPIIGSLYGEKYVFYVSLFLMVFNIHLFTVGIFTLEKGKGSEPKNWMKKLYSPGILAAMTAFGMVMLKVRVPMQVQELAGCVAGITTPLAMIIIGSQLARVRIRDSFKNGKLYFMAFIKLIIYPLIAYAVLRCLAGSGPVTEIVTLLVGLPAAGSVVMLCSEYGGDAELAVQAVCMDILLSLVTLPMWMAVMMR